MGSLFFGGLALFISGKIRLIKRPWKIDIRIWFRSKALCYRDIKLCVTGIFEFPDSVPYALGQGLHLPPLQPWFVKETAFFSAKAQKLKNSAKQNSWIVCRFPVLPTPCAKTAKSYTFCGSMSCDAELWFSGKGERTTRETLVCFFSC